MSVRVRPESDSPHAGFTVVPNAVLLNTELSLQARATYAVLTWHARRAAIARAAQEVLANEVGISERALRDALKELVKAKLVRPERRGRGLVNHYVLLDRQPAPQEPCEPADDAGLDRQDVPPGQAALAGLDRQAMPPMKKEEDEEKSREERNPVTPPGAADEVWATYVEVMQPRRKELDQQGRRLILDALVDATVAECQQAIHGCKASAFHMGANDRGKKYNRLSHILKGKRGVRSTRDQIDLFIDIAEQAGVGGGLQSVDPARLHQAKREVIDAYSFPGDAHAVQLGEEAKRWLEDRGVRVGARESDGFPTFEAAR